MQSALDRGTGRVLTASAAVAGLDHRAISRIVEAASARRAIVVEHTLGPAGFDDDQQIERLIAERPEGWLCTADAKIAPLPGRSLKILETKGLPSRYAEPVVTRLFHLQRSPQLRGLTGSLYDPLEGAWPADEEWSERDASMLVAAPDAVTSAHSDRHHNLLVELTGTKHIVLAEPGTAGHAEAVARSCPRLTVDEMPQGARSVELTAGQAMYLPPYTIHWVRSIDRTVALTCGWRTPSTERAGEAYAAYATLRRLKVRPRPAGGWFDGIAIPVARMARGARSLAAGR